jgi:hypothetical protein
MMKYRSMSIGVELGSAAVEQRLTEIALLMRKTFPHCYWEQSENVAEDDHHKNKMHVVLNGRDRPLCFTDRELINYSTIKRRIHIDHRMHEVLSKLLDV